MKTASSSAVRVSRASHVHHTPQDPRPQMDPVARVMTQNTTPTSAETAASRSHRQLRVRGHR